MLFVFRYGQSTLLQLSFSHVAYLRQIHVYDMLVVSEL